MIKLKIGISVFLILIIAAGAFVLYQNLQFQKNKQQAVVRQIRALNRWETASFSVEKIIDNGSSKNIFQQLLFGNRILLIAHGEVIGGFDLSTLTDRDVQLRTNGISINLPAPQILSTSLKEDQTRVYDRQKGILVPENNNLESDARISAVASIHDAACSEGILQITSDNAKKQLISILSAFKFTDITINIPKGNC